MEVGPHSALKGPVSDVYEQTTGKALATYLGSLSRGKMTLQYSVEPLQISGPLA
jgi:hypothetical protein